MLVPSLLLDLWVWVYAGGEQRLARCLVHGPRRTLLNCEPFRVSPAGPHSSPALFLTIVAVNHAPHFLLTHLFTLCPLQRWCPHPLRPEGSGAMGPGALSSLLLLLLLATGEADMKGHFDPGEETCSGGSDMGDRIRDLDPLSLPVFTQPSAAMPWACRTGPFQTGTSLPPAPGPTPPLLAIAGIWHMWAAPEGTPGASIALPSPLLEP